jgi:hypothetical protein
MSKKNRYRVDFDMGIRPFRWTEYVNAWDERDAEGEARKVFHLNGKPLGWIHTVELLEEGTR